MSRVPQQVEKHVKGQNYVYQKALCKSIRNIRLPVSDISVDL